MKNIQVILIIAFSVFALVGVLLFAFGGRGGESTSGETSLQVTVWGTFEANDINLLTRRLNAVTDIDLAITYRQLSEETFDQVLIEALASGTGPDALFLKQDSIIRHVDKLATLPFESFSERTFKDTFIEEGELYVTDTDIVAFPFSVDPLVLYWNRTHFANAGIPRPPQFWDELPALVPRLTERNQEFVVIRSALAFGEYENIAHAKEILATLMMQAGTSIVGGTVYDPLVTIDAGGTGFLSPASTALTFYTEFANPVKPVYSWNRSLPNSQAAFLAGDVSMYVGFASELFDIRERNPNLNFDIATIPQSRTAPAKKTFATMHALGALKQGDVNQAYRLISLFSGQEALREWSAITGLPPVRRDLLTQKPGDAFSSVFYDSAVIADAFLDPNAQETENIFKRMIEDVTSGRQSSGDVVNQASDLLSRLL